MRHRFIDALLGLVCLFGGFAAVVWLLYFLSYGLALIGFPLMIFGLSILVFGEMFPKAFKVVGVIAVVLGIAASISW